MSDILREYAAGVPIARLDGVPDDVSTNALRLDVDRSVDGDYLAVRPIPFLENQRGSLVWDVRSFPTPKDGRLNIEKLQELLRRRFGDSVNVVPL